MAGRVVADVTLYKFLNGREATHVAGFRYRLRVWQAAAEGPLVACANGYHLLRPEHLSGWIARDLFVAEYDGEMVDVGDKVVVRRARVVEHLAGWNERTARLAAADFAERVLPIFEKRCPGDDRPRLAIQAARDFANGLISRDKLREAAGAARAAWAAWAAAAAWAAGAAGAARAAADARTAGAAEREAQGRIILDYAHGRRS